MVKQGGDGKVWTMNKIFSVCGFHYKISFFAGVDTAELDIGNNLKINLNLNRQPNQETDITYLVRDV